MSHIPVNELVAKARALAKKCFQQGTRRVTDQHAARTVTDQFAFDMSGELEGLAQNIESILNDYTENGQTLTPGGSNQYVGEDGTLKTGDGTS